MNREDLAWAAGIWEGEGCFSAAGRRSPICVLSMTDQDVMERFAGLFPRGKFSGPYLPKNRGMRTKPYWVWRTSSFEHAQALVAALWPWLGERRRAKAAEMLRACFSQRQWDRANRCHPDQPYNGRGMCKRCYHRAYNAKRKAHA